MTVIRVLSDEVGWWLPTRSIFRPVILQAFDLLLSLPVLGKETTLLTGFSMALDAQYYVNACSPRGPRYKALWLDVIEKWLRFYPVEEQAGYPNGCH